MYRNYRQTFYLDRSDKSFVSPSDMKFNFHSKSHDTLSIVFGLAFSWTANISTGLLHNFSDIKFQFNSKLCEQHSTTALHQLETLLNDSKLFAPFINLQPLVHLSSSTTSLAVFFSQFIASRVYLFSSLSIHLFNFGEEMKNAIWRK